MAVSKHKKCRDALWEYYDKVDGKLTPEILHEQYELKYSDWMSWMHKHTQDISAKNMEIITGRLIFRNI